jgi:hypothetical protein
MTVVPLFVFAASAPGSGEEKERHTEFGLQARQLSILAARTIGYANPSNYPRQTCPEAEIGR